MRRKGFRCFECEAPAKHAHHVVPYSSGGSRTIPLCERCHGLAHGISINNHSRLTKAGIERNRAAGGAHGRPKVLIDWQKVKRLRLQGKPWASIAKVLGISTTTLRSHRGRNEDT